MTSRSFLLRSAVAFATTAMAATLPAVEAPEAGCRHACVTGCDINPQGACAGGATGGATCTPGSCTMYFFDCIGQSLYQLYCYEEV